MAEVEKATGFSLSQICRASLYKTYGIGEVAQDDDREPTVSDLLAKSTPDNKKAPR
jgi:hypothetical protein